MSAAEFVVTASGVVHVPHCSTVVRSKSVLAWTPGTWAPGDRRCRLCLPAVPIATRPTPEGDPR